MRIMTQEQFDKLYARHAMWLDGEKGGKRFEAYYRNMCEIKFPKRMDKVVMMWCYAGAVSLRDVCFHGASLVDSSFLLSDFEGADLSEANLRDVSFASCNLRGANFEGADLQHADLYDADAMYANFRGANLHGANLWFKRAKLEVWQAVQRAMTLHVFQTKTAGKGDAAV